MEVAFQFVVVFDTCGSGVNSSVVVGGDGMTGVVLQPCRSLLLTWNVTCCMSERWYAADAARWNVLFLLVKTIDETMMERLA